MGYIPNPPLEDALMHYGTPRHSGRYPWGSGQDPYQHSGDFLSRVEDLKKSGLSESQVAEAMGLKTTELRVQESLAKKERRQLEFEQAKSLKEKGYSNTEIGRQMGKNESSIRSLLAQESEARMTAAAKTASFLKEQVDDKGMIDVGIGVELELGISRDKMDQAVYMLKRDGYEVYQARVEQATNPGKFTKLQVLCKPGTEYKDIYDFSKIKSVVEYTSTDDGEHFDKIVRPASMDSKRMQVRYAEDGGVDKDGLIEIRRGVNDLSLGKAAYSQVRILVDGDKYMKGMAVYSDDLPPGVDVIFNTNKNKGTPLDKVLKKAKTDDPDNPFGSLIKKGGQSYYEDSDGKRKLSLINKRADEGDWNDWQDKLPSQFLAKQNKQLIDKQLGLAISERQKEFDEIMSLTNPTLKKHYLNEFAGSCDSSAVHLHAAALPRQKYQVILPVPSLNDNEVYAPNFKNGEKVALVRYPHGGTFEIPILTVNNRHPDSIKMIGKNPIDAVCINKKNADRLSGADFDGDTVMVVPCNSPNSKIKITSTPPLKGLENFDSKLSYPEIPGMKYMKRTDVEMGKISNLITDMTLKHASQDELARAVKHSMVVIDAEKHKLNYALSEKENGIDALKRKYQAHTDDDGYGGASTLLSKAKSEARVEKRKGSPRINPETGELIYKNANETYVDNKGKVHTRTQLSTKMAETKDARTLISDYRAPAEIAYANYANKLKSLANEARKELVSTPNLKYSPSANKKYINEVNSLMSKLNTSLKNQPKERIAQTMANSIIKAKKEAYPDMTKGEVKKESQRALMEARAKLGAKRHPIEITDSEWDAIQAGAISDHKLTQILRYADADKLRERATPRSNNGINSTTRAMMNTMIASGYTTSEIANRLGLSTTTIHKYLKEGTNNG